MRRKALALLWSLANETNAKTVCKKLTEQVRDSGASAVRQANQQMYPMSICAYAA